MAFDPVAYINEPRWRHSSLGLERIGLLLKELGDPQGRFLSVHVAGTNGKGSTCAYLSSILRKAGLRTGLFTSPYIEHFEERIQVDGRMVSRPDLLQATLEVRDAAAKVEQALGEHPTEFELMCAVAFVHFAETACDVVVVECGLGGRLDATNVVTPALCAIARIGMDHTDVLGGTLAKVAFEKAGIVKRGVPTVSWPQEPEAMDVIRRRCEEEGSRLAVSDFAQLAVDPLVPGAARREFSYRGVAYTTGLLASYQPMNAALAIDAAHALGDACPQLGVTGDAIGEGVAAALWPGRFEAVGRSPLVVVDGAHNPQGAEALASSLDELLAARDAAGKACDDAAAAGGGAAARRLPTLVAGVLADKDVGNIVAPMLPYAARFVVYAPDNPRALPAEALAEEVRRQAHAAGRDVRVDVAPSAAQALRRAVSEEGPEGFVVAFGTLYSIGSMKRALATRPSE